MPIEIGSLLLLFGSFSPVLAETVTLADFEPENRVVSLYTTHKGSAGFIRDTPSESGEWAAQIVIDSAAASKGYFGAGEKISPADLSTAGAIQFWIKTDIQSQFNLQMHSGDSGASVFGFSTGGFDSDRWYQITAPADAFTIPQWSGGEVDWTEVNKWQITAFGSGPYDGKFFLIDELVSVAQSEFKQPASFGTTVLSSSDEPEKRGGPIHLARASKPSPTKMPPPGFRRLFDGKTFDGWKAKARIPVPPYPGGPFRWRLTGDRLETALKNTGRWTIEDGAIVGGQEPPGSGKGAYLVSEETFGDFELMMDMKPDWKTDSGFLVRTLPGGSPGMQILVDHRPQGGIGGFYGNGIAGVHGMAFAIDAEYDYQGNPIRMIAADPNDAQVELSPRTREILDYAGRVDEFLEVWKWGEWNTVKVRCEGRIPKLTTWVNGLKIAVLDMSKIEWENYDAEACAAMLGREGHISLEVHNNNFNHWLGKDRWWPGAVVRWKNIFIRELD